ncbi:hypothetical protein C8R43DRAFT_883162 [Mycena crocata]|nr:hypothetical protein C8R43DRAFT_883162 [Mycena crocata]
MLRKSNLKGYSVPDVLEKVVVRMFADDTTVYLDKTDSFEELQSILDKWCRASSAKFNVGKTEVIPVGSPAYRAFLLAYRKLNDLDGPIPDNIHIVREGESVRILGGHVGNGIDDFVMWTPIVEKIDAALARWEALHPTLEARCQIVQITIGSMTQYLTQVNEMQPQTVNHLLKSQREFMWGGKLSPVQRDMLMAPRLQGGKNMLDLKARNDALQIMKLKTYLDLDHKTRATWCYLADQRLRRMVTNPDGFDTEALGNCFMQKWKPNEKKWPKRHRGMLRCAKKYGVEFDTENPSQEIRGEIPLWHHLAEDPEKRQTNNSPACKCLRENHGVLYVHEGMAMLQRLRDVTHRRTPKCKCSACQDDRRSRGCRNPHACIMAIERKLANLLPKWAPSSVPEVAQDPRKNKPKESSRLSPRSPRFQTDSGSSQ